MQPLPQTKAQWIAFVIYMLSEYGLGKQTLLKASSTFELLVETPIMWVVSKVKSIFTKGSSNDNKPSSPQSGNQSGS